MPIPDRMPPPAFVSLGAKSQNGLDAMGLRLPAQQLGGRLLDGITSVTPTLRYLSLRTWLLWRYATAEPPLPKAYSEFRKYVHRAEAAFAIGNLLNGPVPTTLIGSKKVAKRIADGDTISLDPLANQPALGVYAGPSTELGLTRANTEVAGGIPEWDRELAIPLAKATDEALGNTAVGERLSRVETLEAATREELEEFGRAAAALEIPEAERRVLVRAILPDPPLPHERNRVATYGALLAVADGAPEPLHQDHLLEEAARPERTVPPPLAFILDGWLLYSVRDAMAVSGEFSLRALEETHRALDAGGAGVIEDELVATLVGETAGDVEAAYREYGLLAQHEAVEAVAFSDLADRVRSQTPEAGLDQGIRRWDGPLTEFGVMRANWGVGRGALGLGVLSWLLAERRLPKGLAGNGSLAIAELKRKDAANRFGLERVVWPALRRWREGDLSVAEVLAEYTRTVLDQHLRIAWARMVNEPSRDIAVVRRDGERLLRGASFAPGRAVTRLTQAVSWLEQLRLTEGGRTTDEGRRVLSRILGAFP